MKYIKVFIIIFVILIITGCSKEYSLYINDNKFVEKFYLEVDKNNDYSYILDGDFYPIHNDFVNKFKKRLEVKDDNKILNLEYTYTPSDFVNANSFNQCFDDREVIVNDEKYYIIRLSKPNGCMFNEDYTINIITNNVVSYNNADKIDGNKYIWYVKNSDKNNFRLEIKVEKGTNKSSKLFNKMVIYGFILFLTISVFVAIYIFIKRSKRSNKF